MRDDSLGFFWEDRPKPKGSKRGPRERGAIPPIPVTGWTPPTEFPNLSGAKVIGLDTETYDPELLKEGPGWGRGKGHIIGASLSVEDGSSWYFPVRHGWEPDAEGNWKQVLPPEEMAMNMECTQVMNFLRHTLKDDRPKVGANLIYDIGWLAEELIKVGGRLYDVQFAEALLNSEAPNVDLDSLALAYLGVGKETETLYEWLASWCGGKVGERQRANLYLSPPSLAGPYAQTDASHPLKILKRQWPKMVERGVLDLFDLECRLIPLLVSMRRKGAPVNVKRAEEAHGTMGVELEGIKDKLTYIAGQPVNPNAADSVRSAFEKLGLPIPIVKDKKTGDRKVSFAAPLLEEIEHPLCDTILEHRRLAKVRNVFLKSYIMDKNVNGRVHCSFHPLRGADHGARSGRFSSSDPNLQNIPVRSEIGKMVRTVFESQHGGRWVKADYSQIEYRMLAHHAVGPGSEELRRIYNEAPDTDYHEFVISLIKRMTGIEMERRPAKNINFGLIYGKGKPALIRDLGVSVSKGNALFSGYHEALPYAQATMDDCASEVHRLGYVTTVLGRKSDFNAWAPKKFDEKRKPLPYRQACEKWGMYNIERAMTHKALNRKLQGGAADVMKKAMVEAYEAGIFAEDACGIPCLTVHDELDFEDMNDPNGWWWDEFRRLMENCMPQLKVPVLIDISSGANWGVAD